jgi:hypothetical protein
MESIEPAGGYTRAGTPVPAGAIAESLRIPLSPAVKQFGEVIH